MNPDKIDEALGDALDSVMDICAAQMKLDAQLSKILVENVDNLAPRQLARIWRYAEYLSQESDTYELFRRLDRYPHHA